jgi:hypothetical protein
MTSNCEFATAEVIVSSKFIDVDSAVSVGHYQECQRTMKPIGIKEPSRASPVRSEPEKTFDKRTRLVALVAVNHRLQEM